MHLCLESTHTPTICSSFCSGSLCFTLRCGLQGRRGGAGSHMEHPRLGEQRVQIPQGTAKNPESLAMLCSSSHPTISRSPVPAPPPACSPQPAAQAAVGRTGGQALASTHGPVPGPGGHKPFRLSCQQKRVPKVACPAAPGVLSTHSTSGTKGPSFLACVLQDGLKN